MTDKKIQERSELHYSNLKRQIMAVIDCHSEGENVINDMAAMVHCLAIDTIEACNQTKAETIEKVLDLIIKYIPNQKDLDLLSSEIKQIK